MRLKGLGFKESSHYLRNVGRKDFAIIDRHVLRWLERKVNDRLNKLSYRKIEEILRILARSMRLTLAELDLAIWYEMTGKVLK